ncbi:hypothetical protein, partial [Escherichia coli]
LIEFFSAIGGLQNSMAVLFSGGFFSLIGGILKSYLFRKWSFTLPQFSTVSISIIVLFLV